MLLLVARRAKTATGAVYRRTGKVPYLPVYCALFCPYLHKDKATKRATAFGLLCSIIIPTFGTRTEIDSLTPNLRKCFLFAKN